MASHPYEDQRDFMKGESASTFIKLRRSVDCCTDKLSENAEYDLKVMIAPLEGAQFAKNDSKNILSTPADFDGDQHTYDMPAGLRNKILYRFRLIRTPKKAFLDRVLADIQKSRNNAKRITTTPNVYASASLNFAPPSKHKDCE